MRIVTSDVLFGCGYAALVFAGETDFCAELQFKNPGSIEENSRPQILTAIEETYTVVSRDDVVTEKLPDIVKSQADAHLAATRTLQAAASEIATHHAQKVSQFDEYWRRKHEELDEADKTRRQEHEDRVNDANQQIDDAWAKLKKERAEFELAESRGVRRKLLNKLRAIITFQRRFRSSPTLFRKNAAVYSASVLSLTLGIWNPAGSLCPLPRRQ